MSAPEYSGTIEFPARFIDNELKDLLAEQYEVRFKEPNPRELDHELELQDTVFGEIEVKIVDGVFFCHDGEARYGEFYELEELLVKKGIPFDRESGMDWNAPPAIRIFRPGPPALDYTDFTPNSYEEVVSVRKIRELLAEVRDGFSRREGPIMLVQEGLSGINHIENFLDMAFPAYPPLSDFVAATEVVDDVVQDDH